MIDSIRLQKFRSYTDASFEFEPGVNIIIGANASGKTNLLEAILVLASGKSFRARDIELVQFSKKWARLDGYFGAQPRIVKLILQDLAMQKSFEIDDKPFKRLVLEKTVPVVLFEPSHLQLIPRGPEFRREYFDDILERTQTGYKSLLANYRRALAQRNALLKQQPTSAQKQLFAWNIRLSELGSQIAAARYELVERINKSIGKSYSMIANKRSKVNLCMIRHFPLAIIRAGCYQNSKLLNRLILSAATRLTARTAKILSFTLINNQHKPPPRAAKSAAC